jgi:hypothetical protein
MAVISDQVFMHNKTMYVAIPEASMHMVPAQAMDPVVLTRDHNPEKTPILWRTYVDTTTIPKIAQNMSNRKAM